MKAYVANFEEHGEVVFADDEDSARAIAAGHMDCEPEELEIVRASSYDKYEKGGLTTEVLIREYGWWFECSGCYKRVHQDEDCFETAVYFKDGVFCSQECLDSLNEEKRVRNQEFMDFQFAILSLFPNYDIVGFDGGYPIRNPSATFVFPGAKWTSKMQIEKKELVFYVPRGDVDAYNQWVNSKSKL